FGIGRWQRVTRPGVARTHLLATPVALHRLALGALGSQPSLDRPNAHPGLCCRCRDQRYPLVGLDLSLLPDGAQDLDHMVRRSATDVALRCFPVVTQRVGSAAMRE